MIANMKVLSADQMREVDRLTTERYAMPGLLLMENAAMRCVEAVEERLGPVRGKRALIICGRGNNGGDGAALARQLHLKGASVDLLLLARIDDARGDARTNFEIARKLAATAPSDFRVVEIESAEQLREQSASRAYDLVFDAIFGTGLTRAAAGLFAQAIAAINARRDARVVAIDIPSGIASDESELIGPAVRADLTITFTAPKIGNLLPPASEHNGALVVAPIGSPDELIRGCGSRLTLVERAAIERWLTKSRRSPHANKGDAGKALVVAGSRGKTGAACLAGEAALRAGAGLVTVATPASSQPVVASQLIPECMTEALEETGAGTIAEQSRERVMALANERDVLAIGPGLGSSDQSTRSLVRSVVAERQRPVVLDADALNSLAPWTGEIRGSRELPLILTPHPGEMSRLVGVSISDVVINRIEIAREFAMLHGVILVLKGSRTLIASPDGEVYINPTGNAAMATAGTGDVLTGIIAGLLAQKSTDALGATIAAVYLHGLAGDIAAERAGTRAMIASDILNHLGEAFIEAGGAGERFARQQARIE